MYSVEIIQTAEKGVCGGPVAGMRCCCHATSAHDDDDGISYCTVNTEGTHLPVRLQMRAGNTHT